MKIFKKRLLCGALALCTVLCQNFCGVYVYGQDTDYDVAENVLYNAKEARVSVDSGNPYDLSAVGKALADGIRENAPISGKTKWLVMTPGKEAYAQFEMEEPTAVYEISVYSQTGSGTGDYPITGFVFQSSMDGIEWTDVVEVKDNEDNLCTRRFDAVVGKFFRIKHKSKYGFRVTEIQLKPAYTSADFEKELDVNEVRKSGRFNNAFVAECPADYEPEFTMSINGTECPLKLTNSGNVFKWSIDVPVDTTVDDYVIEGKLISKKYDVTLLSFSKTLTFYHYVDFLEIVNSNGSVTAFKNSLDTIWEFVASYGYDAKIVTKDSTAAIEKIKNIVCAKGPYPIEESSIPVIMETIKLNMPMISVNSAETSSEMMYSVTSYKDDYELDLTFAENYTESEKEYFYKYILEYRNKNGVFTSNEDIANAVEYAKNVTVSYPAYAEYLKANALTVPKVFKKYKNILDIDMSYIKEEYKNQTLFLLKQMNVESYFDIPEKLKEAYEKAKKDNEIFKDNDKYEAAKEKNFDIKPGIEKEITALPTENHFKDMENFDWAVEAVESLYTKGIVNGKTERFYAPFDNVTREEFVKMIVGAFKIEVIPDNAEFTDVDDSEWYAPYIKAACSRGVVQGHSEGEFGVGEYITREDMAVILYRVASIRDMELDMRITETFADADEIAPYAQNPVGILYHNNILSGTGEGYFEPKQSANRAEAAVMIYKLLSFGGESNE